MIRGFRAGGYVGGELAGEVGIHHGLGVEDQLAEGLNGHQCAVGNEAIRESGADGVPGGGASFKREAFQSLHRGFADAADRGVDHALQGHGVVRVADQAEVAKQVLDLGALVKAEAADHGVTDVVAAEGFLDQAGLGVGAVKDGAVSFARLLCGVGLTEKLLDPVGNEQGFVFSVWRLVITDQASTLAVGPQLLAFAAQVVRDNSSGGLKNDLRRSVVLLQSDDAGVGEVLLKLENITDVGASPGIDALILVADCADVFGLAGEQLHELVLGAIGVLIFVDEEIAVASLVTLSRFA